MSNIVVTQMGHYIVSAEYQDGKPLNFQCELKENSEILGNIYIGKVITVVKNIQAAFVKISEDTTCYYSLKDNPLPVFVKRFGKKDLVQGDEILVQVSKEALKTKDPVVTSNLNLPGRYMALTTGNHKIGFSSKFSKQKKEELREIFTPLQSPDFGIVVRTNAQNATKEELLWEYERLSLQYRQLVSDAVHRTVYTKMYTAEAFYIQQLRNIYENTVEKIVTDIPEIYQEMNTYLTEFQPKDREKLTLYEDASLPLTAVYNLKRDLDRALQKNVWLKSGAYLVIEPTEACTVIDVNTGKYDGKNKDREKTFLKINLEAAKEVARQLRLRNLSGIIIVDFIDMSEEEHREALLSQLQIFLRQDPIPANLVDMTGLQMVEITRKKVKKPLHEQVVSKQLLMGEEEWN